MTLYFLLLVYKKAKGVLSRLFSSASSVEMLQSKRLYRWKPNLMLNVPRTDHLDLFCFLHLTLCQRSWLIEHHRKVAARSHQLLSEVASFPFTSCWCRWILDTIKLSLQKEPIFSLALIMLKTSRGNFLHHLGVRLIDISLLLQSERTDWRPRVLCHFDGIAFNHYQIVIRTRLWI